MIILKLCLTLVVIIFVTQKSEAIKLLRDEDSLLESFEDEEWSDAETPCKEAMISLLKGVKNNTVWASWIWDSMQQPVGALYGSRYHLGNFDQCLEAPWSQPWRTQYCLVDVRLTEQTRPHEGEFKDPYGNVEDFISMETKHGRKLNSYFLGVCAPDICTPSSVAKISRHILKQSYLPIANIIVEPRNCQVKMEKPYSIQFYLFWFIMTSMATICLLVYVVENSLSHPKLIEVASCFSPSRNYKALTKTSPDELASLNGIRVMCAGIAVTMHYFYYVAVPSAMNPTHIGKDMESMLGRIINQLVLSIDTFFVMSGLLHMKGLMASCSDPVKMLWKRYLRLLAPFAMSLWYMTAVLPYTVTGPLFPKLVKEQTETCIKNWWLGPLMLNNYIRNDAICHVVTWYLSCDYQLTIFGTVVFCLCQKLSRRNIVKLFSGVLFLSMMIPGVLTYMNQLAAVFAYNIEDAGHVDLNKIFLTTYMKSHSRSSAYIIGLAMGYIIHLYKPKDSRKKISKQLSIFGGIMGLCILISIMGIGGTLFSRKYNVFDASVYASIDKSIWAIGICCLIIVTEYGTFPIIGDFLTSKIFTSLSRLTYIMYLIHPALLFKRFYSTRVPMTYSFFEHVLDGFGFIVVSCLLSYLLWFILEAPMVNMINFSFKNRSNKNSHVENGTPNGIPRPNGLQNGSKMHNGNGTKNGTTKQVENFQINGKNQKKVL